MTIKRTGSLFFSAVLLGLAVLVGISTSTARAQTVPLGSQIVCFVFTSLNNVGTPIPHLTAGDCIGAPQFGSGTLTVSKMVIGGTASPSDFSIHITSAGGEVSGSPQPGSPSGTSYIGLTPGDYTVSETGGPANYTASFLGCDSHGVISVASSSVPAICTITNTYVAPVTPVASTSDLSLTKSVSSTTPTKGANITYTLTVHNAGPDAAQHVSVTDLLPAGLTYVSDDGSGAYASGTGLWNVGTVTTLADAVLHIIATVGNTTNTISNTASITAASSTDPNSTNNTATASITPAPSGGGVTATTSDLSITKTVSSGAPAEGANITYTLTVHNAGPDAAQHVSVTDLLPVGLTYVSDDGSDAYVPTTGVWSIGTVGTTSDAVLHIVATVGNTTNAIANTASITVASSTDPNSANNTASVSVTPVAPGGGGSVTTPTASGGGGGGGGIISGPLSFGYGGGLVLGTSTEADAAVSTSTCGPYLTSYLRMGRPNSADQVRKLQTFLNSYLGTKLPVTGFFGQLTDAAVRKFQAQYAAEVLEPWFPHGLAANETTGYVYKTTQRKINLLACSDLTLPMPLLP